MTAEKFQSLQYWQDKFWQIQRYHASDIKLTISFTPDYGNSFCFLTLQLCGVSYFTQGLNLWKRFRYAVEVLEACFRENAYKYNAPPIGIFKPKLIFSNKLYRLIKSGNVQLYRDNFL